MLRIAHTKMVKHKNEAVYKAQGISEDTFHKLTAPELGQPSPAQPYVACHASYKQIKTVHKWQHKRYMARADREGAATCLATNAS